MSLPARPPPSRPLSRPTHALAIVTALAIAGCAQASAPLTPSALPLASHDATQTAMPPSTLRFVAPTPAPAPDKAPSPVAAALPSPHPTPTGTPASPPRPTPAPTRPPTPEPTTQPAPKAPSLAAAKPTPTPDPRATVLTTTEVPFTPAVPCAEPSGSTCRLAMDIVRPSGGGPWPTLVLLRGGPASPTGNNYLLPFATALAHAGAVVMIADWRQASDTGGGWPTSFQDAACAVGVARAITTRYGGQPGNVTAVGHSLGGWAVAVVGLTPTPFTPRAGTCNATAGSLRPDRIVDLDGATDEPVRMEDGAAYVAAFFDGTPVQQPAAYAAAEALQIIKRYPGGDSPIPILLVHGSSDTIVAPSVSSGLNTALEASGYPNRLLWVTGGHAAALSSSTVVTDIMRLAR